MDKIQAALQRTTDTKALIIEKGAVSRTGEMFKSLFPGMGAIIIADTNTWEVAGKSVARSLEANGIACDRPHIFNDPHFYAEWEFVDQLQDVLGRTQAIAVAVGSGVINDLTKYVSSRCGKKYICVGTAASMDGYTAYGASITKDGNKQTVDCPAPYGFIMDPEIAARAPKDLAASGYADLIAKVPAGADWMLADATGNEPIDKFAWDLVQDGLKETLGDPKAIWRGDIDKTGALCEGLLMSGFAMQAIQSSRPASGAEHQFSHCWDMENLSYPDGVHVSHGFKVGIGTLVSTASLELLLGQDIENLDIAPLVDSWKTWDEQEKEIRIIFAEKPGHLARALVETKAKYVDKEGFRAQLEALRAAWPSLKGRIRAQIYPFDEVYNKLRLAGAPYEPEMICVSRERLRTTIGYIPFMRSRFTNIDLVYRLGLMPALVDRLCGPGAIWEIK